MKLSDWINLSISVATFSVVFLQFYIYCKQKRDNLFKIRYEFYLEICQFINDSLRKVEQEDYESEYMGLERDQLSHGEELAVESSFNSHIEERLIFKTKCLFGSDVANYLMQHLNYQSVYQSVYKSSCKNKKKYLEFIKKR